LEPGQVLYPTSDELAWLIAASLEALSRFYRLYAPPIESLVRLLDKEQLVKDALRAGLEVPETSVPRTVSDVESSGRSLGFPLYVKPRAQVFGHGSGKGTCANNPAELLHSWRSQLSASKYDAEVLKRIPDISLPILQSYHSSTERIYTIDGFVDETGELYAMLACVKVLQRPRGSGPGIIFEHAQTDPIIEQGLLRLFGKIGYFGIFDAEFIECGDRKLLIDINPRFYNHMAFETERGLHLPLLAYLAATGNRQKLKDEIEQAKYICTPKRAYVHRLSTKLLLILQRMASQMSREDLIRWRCWISKNQGAITDPVYTPDDPFPAVAEVAMEAATFVRHPRSYLRGLWKTPSPTFSTGGL
jgi:predicted ATP-grasp superfamily ATP-dependent carboligase